MSTQAIRLPASLPALLIAITVAFGGAWFATAWASFGYAFLIGLPFVVGFLIGYYAYTRGLLTGVLISIALVSALGLVLTAELGGLLCGIITTIIVLIPAFVGGLVGDAARRRHLGTPQHELAALLVALIPMSLWAEARLTPAHALETIETARIVPMERMEAWSAAAFYEDVQLPRPTLLRIGLPTPLGTSGRQDRVGAIVECYYDTGHIAKRMTEVVPGELLAFEILVQSGIEDRSAALRYGSLRFQDIPPRADGAGGGTRVTLSSTYEPLLDARSAWRPFERLICHTLHDHILDGIESAGTNRKARLSTTTARIPRR